MDSGGLVVLRHAEPVTSETLFASCRWTYRQCAAKCNGHSSGRRDGCAIPAGLVVAPISQDGQQLIRDRLSKVQGPILDCSYHAGFCHECFHSSSRQLLLPKCAQVHVICLICLVLRAAPSKSHVACQCGASLQALPGKERLSWVLALLA